MLAVIAQVLTIGSNYCASWSTKKLNIILFKILSAVFNALSILFIGNIAGAIPVFFTVIRCVVCFYKDKFKTNKPIYFICFGYILIAILSIPLYKTFIDVLPVVISLWASIVLWFFKPIGIKIGIGIGDAFWMIYDFANGLYLSAINLLAQLILSGISIIRIRKKGDS